MQETGKVAVLVFRMAKGFEEKQNNTTVILCILCVGIDNRYFWREKFGLRCALLCFLVKSTYE